MGKNTSIFLIMLYQTQKKYVLSVRPLSYQHLHDTLAIGF